jgi:hypothetical protein
MTGFGRWEINDFLISGDPLNQLKVPRFILSAGHWQFGKSKTYGDGAPELMNLGTGLNVFPSPNGWQGCYSHNL